MLEPKKLKYRKHFRPQARPNQVATSRATVSFGAYGLKSLQTKWVTARQIEASRRAMAHSLKRGGKIWIRIFPDQPITLKGGEIRMGGGKGSPDHFIAHVKAGMMLFELDGIPESEAREAFRLASHKLPVKTSFVNRDHV